jgi:hypothetical protein
LPAAGSFESNVFLVFANCVCNPCACFDYLLHIFETQPLTLASFFVLTAAPKSGPENGTSFGVTSCENRRAGQKTGPLSGPNFWTAAYPNCVADCPEKSRPVWTKCGMARLIWIRSNWASSLCWQAHATTFFELVGRKLVVDVVSACDWCGGCKVSPKFPGRYLCSSFGVMSF